MTMGRLFKQSLAVVKQNRVLSLFSLAEPFIVTFIFFEQLQQCRKLIVEGHLFF